MTENIVDPIVWVLFDKLVSAETNLFEITKVQNVQMVSSFQVIPTAIITYLYRKPHSMYQFCKIRGNLFNGGHYSREDTI